MNLKWTDEFPQCDKMLVDMGWFSFFERVSSYNVELMKYFAKNYTNSPVNFQTLKFEVNEGSIAEATCLPVEGEWWFKKNLSEVDLSMYLLPGYEDLDWSKGIHLNDVKQEWRDVLSIVHHYITWTI